MGSKGSGSQTQVIRWAPYIEAAHIEFLELIEDHRAALLLDQDADGIVDSSPYRDYDPVDIEVAFFGSGYALSSFPSLYDMYGKFMAGLDVEVLYDQILAETIDGPVIHDLVSAEADKLSDDIEQEAIPRFETGLRDINSVMSSSFVIGKALMETARTKAISRFSAEARFRLLPVATDRWRGHLEWNKAVIDNYSQILKFYFVSKMDVDSHLMEVNAKNRLWPFTILDYNRIALGAINGAQNVQTDVAGASRAQKVIGGALGGAAAGAQIGSVVPGLGTALGAGIGAALGLAGGFL